MHTREEKRVHVYREGNTILPTASTHTRTWIESSALHDSFMIQTESLLRNLQVRGTAVTQMHEVFNNLLTQCDAFSWAGIGLLVN